MFQSAGWLEPLLDEIAKNRTTVVCPVIDVIDDTTLEYHYQKASGTSVGGFDWNLQVRAEATLCANDVTCNIEVFSGTGVVSAVRLLVSMAA